MFGINGLIPFSRNQVKISHITLLLLSLLQFCCHLRFCPYQHYHKQHAHFSGKVCLNKLGFNCYVLERNGEKHERFMYVLIAYML